MSFDFGYTCPDINKSIDSLKSEIDSYLSDLVQELCPLLDGEPRTNIIKEYKDYLYSVFERSIEDVRSTNQDMRNAAEKQIDSIESEKSNLEEEVKELNQKISELEDSISDLENEINAA